jgi:Tol biopolymer transport system component
MLRGRFVALFLLAAAACIAAAPATAGITERVSVSSDDQQANGASGSPGGPCVSANGRFVAFESDATNLVSGDTNGQRDVFVRDLLAGSTERVSITYNGFQGNEASEAPAISADGRWVAFQSYASNLVRQDRNGHMDVFVRDRLGGWTTRASDAPGALYLNANGDSGWPSISADGRYIAFESEATNLVAGDTNGVRDVFVRDLQSLPPERVSVSSTGAEGNQVSHHAGAESISADGRYVVFDSEATNLVPGDTNGQRDVFIRDRRNRTTDLVSVSSLGQQGNGESWHASISGDGSVIAFYSTASNLLAGDTNGAPDIFVRDLVKGTTERVSVSSGGEQGNGSSGAPWISGDGRYVAFDSTSNNLVPADTNGTWDVFVHDIQTGATERVSVSSGDGQGNNVSHWPSISGDGRFVVFVADAGNLVPSDTNGLADVFVRDRSPETVPPETAIVYGPCGLVASSSDATICFAGSDNETLPQGLRYSWRLDSGGWSAVARATCSDLTGLPEGAHVFEVRAMDACENVDPTPAQCQFTVDLSGPSVSIMWPTWEAPVRRVVNISAAASHASGVQKVEFYAAGQLISTDTSEPYYCSWDTGPVSVAEGPTQICAKAYANDGKIAWACVLVTVDNITFDDVPKTMSQWPFVETLARAAITSGCSATPPLYCPYSSVTRAQMAVFLCKAAGNLPLYSPTPTFGDVGRTSWEYGYVECLADAASWGGNPPTSGCRLVGTTKYFCPNDPVTREQMAKFLCLAAGKSAMPSCSGKFCDVPSSNAFCAFIERLTDGSSWPGGTPVTSGCACPTRFAPTCKCYCPKSNVTRGQMAVFLVKAFGIPPAVELISPAQGAVLDNGRIDGLDYTVWDFDWADFPRATRYHLYVKGSNAVIPMINNILTESSFHFSGTGYIIDANRFGWTWKVRAELGGIWGDWSETRTFDVEPVNTDPPW